MEIKYVNGKLRIILSTSDHDADWIKGSPEKKAKELANFEEALRIHNKNIGEAGEPKKP